jgi:hypothetical protein
MGHQMSNTSGKFSYFTTHTAIMFHPDLNIKAVRLFEVIDYFANNKRGYCWAQNDMLAYKSAQSLKSLENNLRLLEKLSFIKRKLTKIKYEGAIPGSTRIRTERRIFVIIDKNVVPDYVPDFINNENKELKDHPPMDEVGHPSLDGSVISSYNNNSNKSLLRKDPCTPKGALTPNDGLPELRRSFKRKQPINGAAPTLLINSWNKIPLATSHTKPDTKVYKATVQKLKWLLDGTFGRHCAIPKHILKDLEASDELLNKPWSTDMILSAFDNFSKAFKEGNMPQNKKVLPRSLSDFIFNKRTGFPSIIKYHIWETLPLGKPRRVDGATIRLWDRSNATHDSKEFRDLLHERLYEINYWWNQLRDDPPEGRNIEMWEKMFAETDPIRQYADWLIEETSYDWSVRQIGLHSKHFYQFKEHLKAVHFVLSEDDNL